MNRVASACAIAIAAAAGCVPRVDALVICHNANCAESEALEGDDTVAALTHSLALRGRDGSVAFDGIELDSVWERATRRCSFAHEPGHADGTLGDAAALVAAHVASAPPGAAGHGAVFYFKIELKTDVGGGAAHTPDEAAAHIACGTAAATAVVTAGAASDNTVVPIFDSDDPALLAAINPAPYRGATGAGCLFETGWDARLPDGFEPQILTAAWYEAAPQMVRDQRGAAALRTASGAGASGLAIWARSPSVEELYAILLAGPRYIVVNNVQDLRALLDTTIGG